MQKVSFGMKMPQKQKVNEHNNFKHIKKKKTIVLKTIFCLITSSRFIYRTQQQKQPLSTSATFGFNNCISSAYMMQCMYCLKNKPKTDTSTRKIKINGHCLCAPQFETYVQYTDISDLKHE